MQELEIYAAGMVDKLRAAHKLLCEVAGLYQKAQEERDDAPEAEDMKEEMLDHQIEVIFDSGVLAQSCTNILAEACNKLVAEFEMKEEKEIDVTFPDFIDHNGESDNHDEDDEEDDENED